MTVAAQRGERIAPGIEPIRLHVRRLPAIDPDPPYEDEPPALLPAAARTWTDGALALAPEVPPDDSIDARVEETPLRLVATPGHLEVQTPEPEPEHDPDAAVPFDALPTPLAELPPVRQRAAVLVRAVLEVLAGDRSAVQLMRCTSPDVYSDLESRLGRPAPRPWAATLRSLHVFEPTPGVAEVAAVIRRGMRAGAVAMRLEGLDGRWQVTALELV